MFNDIKEELLNKNLKAALVNLFVYPDDSYAIVPLGKSPEKKWIGSKNINYKKTGNLSNGDKIFKDNLYDCLKTSCCYADMGLEAIDKDTEQEFFSKGIKEKFEKYHYVSIVLFATTDKVRINELKTIDSRGSEWVGKSDTSVEISIDDMEKSIFTTVAGVLKKNCR